MGVDPAGWVDKIDDLRITFVNMHHLLNEYRPHQVLSFDYIDIGAGDVMYDDGRGD
jgi:hypothetical protein